MYYRLVNSHMATLFRSLKTNIFLNNSRLFAGLGEPENGRDVTRLWLLELHEHASHIGRSYRILGTDTPSHLTSHQILVSTGCLPAHPSPILRRAYRPHLRMRRLLQVIDSSRSEQVFVMLA